MNILINNLQCTETDDNSYKLRYLILMFARTAIVQYHGPLLRKKWNKLTSEHQVRQAIEQTRIRCEKIAVDGWL